MRRRLQRLLDRLRGPGYRCPECGGWFNYSHVCGDRDQHVYIWMGDRRYAKGDNDYIPRRAKPPGDLS
jgi:hypothetical protein